LDCLFLFAKLIKWEDYKLHRHRRENRYAKLHKNLSKVITKLNVAPFDETDCTTHVDIYYTVSVLDTAVFLKIRPRVRKMGMKKASRKIKFILTKVHFVGLHNMTWARGGAAG
jgi:hypothetical protein